jgi:hypothetical protein
MRGDDLQQEAMFSYLSPADRVPQDHPLRPIRRMVNQALAELTGEFQAMYAREGRPSIPPEKLLRALVLQILYTIRSVRLLMEQLDYNLLFRWFVGLSTGGGDLRVDENRGQPPEDQAPRRGPGGLCFHPDRGDLQSGAHAQLDGPGVFVSPGQGLKNRHPAGSRPAMEESTRSFRRMCPS